MKKKNEVKDEKKKEKKFKSKWKTWMTVVVSIASVFFISGVTVLGVYLAGGFDEKITMPESIAFEYDSNLYNSNHGQLEVGEDFQLTITSPTEDVTKRKIELSFGNGVLTDYDPVNELISNKSIQVPKYVSLGRPFNVHLLTKHLVDENGNPIKDKDDNYINWIAGGISKLVARSQNIQIGTTEINIAVDVPVYSTETLIYNSRGELTTQVVRNESFTVQTKYIPADSKYMYSDNKSSLSENEWREKRSYYEAINTENIKAVYDDNHTLHFVASNHAEDNIRINGYTFITAKSQLDYDNLVGEIDNSEYYYTGVLAYLSERVQTDVNSSDKEKIARLSYSEISIGEENIGQFTVSKVSQTISMNVESPLNLYLNQYPYQSNSDFLGVRVYSSSGLLLDNLLKNIAISFDYNGIDPTQGANKTLSIVGDEKVPYVDIEGKRYYKPNSSVNDLRYANWKLSATEAMELKINVVLLVNDDSQLFADVNGQVMISQVNLSISKHEELPLSWSDQSDLNVLLNYKVVGDESKIESVTLDLNQYATVPAENIYQDKVFFVSFGDGPLADYIDMANRIIGENGYILERSGRYQTNSGRMTTLFAVNGSRLSLYNTGEFSLYFATVRPSSSEGLYDIAEMCSSTKNVASKTALYSNSIKDFYINASNFLEDDEQEISINLGSDLDFKLIYTIASESVPVFKDEFQKGFIRPVVYDMAGNDISEYFIYDEGTLLTDTETKVMRVEYSVSTKSSVQIESINGLYLGYISLIYDNGDENIIEWKRDINSISDKLINIYKPKAVSISVKEMSDVYNSIAQINAEVIKVDQNLTKEGGFNTEITVTLVGGTTKTFNNVTEFINDIAGANGSNFVITDQKGKTSTLRNQWKFTIKEGNAGIINILPNGQSFAFKNTNSNDYIPLSLIIKSNDENSTLTANEKPFEIKFNVKSTGISKIKYDSLLKTYQTNINLESSDTSKEVIVKKYGASFDKTEDVIELKNLIELYINSDGNSEEKFSLDNVNFKFTAQYLAENRLSNVQLLELFGNNGMLTLYDNNGLVSIEDNLTADQIRSKLTNINISNVKINKNFAAPHFMEFAISDSSGAVNIMFTLQLLQNVTVTNDSYTGEKSVWANAETTLANKVKLLNSSEETSNELNSLFEGKIYYIVMDDKYEYTLSETKSQNAIGEYDGSTNKIKFYDFWNVEKQIFTIYFRPEGNNSFALNQPIQFEVKRDLIINDKEKVFYVLGENSKQIGDYVLLTRHDGVTSIQDKDISFVFENYLEFKDGNVEKKSNADFFFDYNQEFLTTNLFVRSGNIELGKIAIKIKLIESDDIYSLLASTFSLQSNNSIKPQSQIINNGEEDINYLMFARNAGQIWQAGNLTENYKVSPSHRDRFGNVLSSIYQAGADNSIQFQSKVNQQLLFGLNNENCYIVLNIVDSGNKILATVHVPLLISQIGYDFVVYDKEIQNNRRVETSLLRPEQLIDKGIYNEIEAGKLSQILSQYDFADRFIEIEGTQTKYKYIQEGGLYTIPGFEQYLNIYKIDKEGMIDYSSLVNSKYVIKTDADSNGFVILNHLSNNLEDVYVAFEYKIDYYGISQSFYYLLKVIADVEVENSTYAYNGSAEYIFGDSSSISEINLEELFDNKTLNSDKKRFYVNKILNLKNVVATTYDLEIDVIDTKLELDLKSDSKLMFTYKEKEVKVDFAVADGKSREIDLNDYFVDDNDKDSGITKDNLQIKIAILEGDMAISYQSEKIFETLKFKNEIVSVEVGDEIMTDSEQWDKTIELSFSSDFKTLYYRPFGKYADSKMTIIIKHTYQTTEDDNLSVIGGEQTYKLILNEDSEVYAVRFTDKDGKVTETDKLKLTINNGNKYSASEDKDNIYSMQVDLLKKEAGNIDTIIRDRADVGISAGAENIKGIDYNPSTGLLAIKLKDYIDSDKKISLAVYTTMGYLASIEIDLKANITFISNTNTFNGGDTLNLKGAIKLTEGEIVVTDYDYSFKSLSISGDGKDLVSCTSDGQLTISDLISDKKIKIDYTVSIPGKTENDIERIFNFSCEYTLKANITPITNIAVDDEVIAGTGYKFNIADLYDGDIKNTLIDISCASTNPAFGGIEKDQQDKNKVIIKTNHVSDKVTLTLTLKVRINFPKMAEENEENQNYSAYQEFEVVYSFVVAPSVKLSSNYPVPNSSGMMKFEYIDSGATFENIKTFLNSTAIFGENSRIDVLEGRLSTDSKVVEYKDKVDIENEDLIVQLNSKTDNAEIYVGDSEKGVAINGSIDLSQKIKFARTNNSGDAKIELSITYKAVNIVYNIRLLENSLSIVPHTVSNFTMQGEYQNTSVSYEKIYIDKTNTKDLFAGERLVYAELGQMAEYQDEYYFVFEETIKDETSNEEVVKYYASYPNFISAKDQDTNRYYDLGISFVGKTFKGLYLASSIENNKIQIDATTRALQVNDKPVLESELPTNLASSVFKLANGQPKVSLANRAQMTYGIDEDGNTILVDFEKYDSLFNKQTTENVKPDENGESGEDIESIETVVSEKDYFSIDIEKTPFDEINKKEFSLTFDKNDGSIVKLNAEFSFNYYYMAGFDIDVKEKISTLKNIVEIEVNNTYDSINDLLGIYHPTTNRMVSYTDFTGEESGLGFELLYYNGGSSSKAGETNSAQIDEATQKVLNEYMGRYDINAFKRTVNDTGTNSGKEYMFVGPIISTTAKCIYDYELIPFGAKNTGDYVLGKITYKVEGFETFFYVVIKIMPDYEVSYGGSAENGKEEIVNDKTIISNFDMVDKIEILSSNSTKYKEFKLTGADGFMTIKHKNGTGEREELSTSKFAITMKVNEIIEGVTYNDNGNLLNKIFYGSSLPENSQDSGWQFEKDQTTISNIKYKGTDSIAFNDVKAVIFGNQYYFIEGVDDYGFTYRLYFMLKATKNIPAITNSISIAEEDYIDLSAQYTELTIKNGNNDNYVINSSETKIPLSSDERVKVLNFEGIDAWQYVEDYTIAQVNDNDKIYLDNISNTNQDKAYEPHKELKKQEPSTPETVAEGDTESEYEYEINIDSEGQKYLNFPMIDKIKVENISLFDPKTNQKVGNVEQTESSSVQEWAFATDGNGFFGNETTQTGSTGSSDDTTNSKVYNHGKPRPVYGKAKEDGEEKETYSKQLYVMPKLLNTDLYKDGDSAVLKLVVRLKYEDNDNSIFEYCDCTTEITVVRKAQIEQKENRVVRDGQAFALSDKIVGSVKDENEAVSIDGFINDTIEVLVKANSTAIFDLNLEREGKIYTNRISLSNTSSNIAITKYESISNALGVYVKPGDNVTVTNIKDVIGIYYITNTIEENSNDNLRDVKIEAGTPTGQVWSDKNASTEATFTISTIDKDVVYVENVALLADNSYSINKYYIAQCKFTKKEEPSMTAEGETAPDTEETPNPQPTETTYDYRITANYEVTGYVYKLKRDYVDEIGFTLDNGITSLEDWSNGAFSLYKGYTPGGGKIDINLSEDGKIAINDEKLSNYISFRLDNKGGDISLGNANIDSITGEIELTSNFNPNQYIRVEVLMKVSGIDRNIITGEDEANIILGKLNLSTKR